MKSYKPKSCARCGEQFKPRSGAAKYCDTCRPEVKRKWQVDWRTKHRKRFNALCLKAYHRRKLKLICEILSKAKELTP